jgi:hypothetical protein
MVRAFREVDPHAREAGRRWAREIQSGMGDVDVQLKADTSKAKDEIRHAAEDQKATIEVDADTAKAEAQIDTAARDRKATIKVDTDKSTIDKVTGSLDKLGDSVGKIGSTLAGPLKLQGIMGAIGIAPNIVPVIGSVVQSVGQLSGLLGLLPAAAGTAGLAMASLKIATAGFGDAIKAVGDPKKFAEAIAQLAPNAQSAALSIQGLMPQITQLKMTVQDAFFQGFGDQITALGNTYLPVFRTVMSQMAASANASLTGISKMLQTPQMQADIQAMTGNMARAFDTLTHAVQPVVHAFSDIATVGAGFLPQITQHIVNAANAFDRFITNARDTGKLAGWIQGGIDAFTSLKNIVVNIGTSLKGIFEAAAGPGGAGGLLATIETLTRKLSDWVNSVGGQNMLKTFFAEGRAELEKWWPVLQELPGIFWNAFQQLKAATDLWFPILRAVADLLNQYPGLIDAVVIAFAAWKTISGVTSLITSLNTIAGLLRLTLPAAAAEGAGGITTALAGISAPAWLTALVGGGAVAALGAGTGTAVDQGYDVTSSRFGQRPGHTGAPPPADADLTRLPGQNHGVPPSGRNPGDVVDKDTPGAVPMPGTNKWVIPDVDSGRKTYTYPTPQSSSGGREPDQSQYFPPAPTPPPPTPAPPPLPTPPVSAYVPPATPSPAAPAGPSPAAPGVVPVGPPITTSGFNWDAVAQDESGGNWSNDDTGHSGHFGGLQFSLATWQAYGGDQFAANPKDATPEQQKMIADRVAFYGYNGLAPQGLGAWQVIAQGKPAVTAAGISTASKPPNASPVSVTGSPGSPGALPSSTTGSGTPVFVTNWPTGLGGGVSPAVPGATGSDQALLSRVPAGHYSQEGNADLTKGLGDCSSAVEDLVNLLQGRPTGGREMSTSNAAAWLTAHGFVPTDTLVPGAFNVGFNTEHMQATLPGGTNFNWGSDAAAALGGRSGGGAFDPTQGFTSHYYLPAGANNPLPTGNPGDPLNVQLDPTIPPGGGQPQSADAGAAKGKGEELGKNFVDGLFQAFGFDGTVFKDPRQFGLVKLGTALFNYFNKLGESITNPTSASGNNANPNAPSGGSAGGGGGVGSLLSLIPKPFGPPNVADKNTGMGGGAAAVDNSIHVNIGSTKAAPQDVWNTVDNYLYPQIREPARNLPVPPR